MQNGFGLLEVLTTLLLLALGMLSLVNGLLRAEQHSMESLMLAQADVQAINIYEHMLANPLGVKQGAYYHLSGEPHCNPCDPNLQAAKDLHNWQQQLQQQLWDAQGEVRPQQEIYLHWQSMFAESNMWILYAE